jgi:hypothetical protein
VGLDTAKYLNNSEDDAAQSLRREAGLPGVAGGLRLVTWGYSLLVVAGALGGGLIWVAASDDTARALGLTPDGRAGFLLAGLAVVGVGGLVAVASVLLGQWRCLMYAPQQQAAKEVMLVCITCLGLGSLFSFAAGVAGAVPLFGAHNPQDPPWLFLGGILGLVGGGAILVGLLAFTQFLRTVAGCLRDRTGARGADVALGLAGLLIGATAGAFFCLDPLDPDSTSGLWLAGGWGLWLLSHLWLASHVRRALRAELLRMADPEPAQASEVRPGSVKTLTLSGMRRLVEAGSR